VASKSWRNCNGRLQRKSARGNHLKGVSQFHSHHYLFVGRVFVFSPCRLHTPRCATQRVRSRSRAPRSPTTVPSRRIDAVCDGRTRRRLRGGSCAPRPFLPRTTLAESRAALRATTAGASFGAFSGGARGRRRGECIALPGSGRCVGLHGRRAPRTPRDRGSCDAVEEALVPRRSERVGASRQAPPRRPLAAPLPAVRRPTSPPATSVSSHPSMYSRSLSHTSLPPPAPAPTLVRPPTARTNAETRSLFSPR
jgi:hypothetical protein